MDGKHGLPLSSSQGINCKIGADSLAVMTVDAKIGLLYRRGVVSLGVEALGRFKDIPRTIFNAISATLAPVLYDMDLSFGHNYFTGIQGNTPEFHIV